MTAPALLRRDRTEDLGNDDALRVFSRSDEPRFSFYRGRHLVSFGLVHGHSAQLRGLAGHPEAASLTRR